MPLGLQGGEWSIHCTMAAFVLFKKEKVPYGLAKHNICLFKEIIGFHQEIPDFNTDN